jgi:hypothetical protein
LRGSVLLVCDSCDSFIKFILKVGVEESIVNASPITDQRFKSNPTFYVVCFFSDIQVANFFPVKVSTLYINMLFENFLLLNPLISALLQPHQNFPLTLLLPPNEI